MVEHSNSWNATLASRCVNRVDKKPPPIIGRNGLPAKATESEAWKCYKRHITNTNTGGCKSGNLEAKNCNKKITQKQHTECKGQYKLDKYIYYIQTYTNSHKNDALSNMQD